MTTTQKPTQEKIFTPYHAFVIAILTIIQSVLSGKNTED